MNERKEFAYDLAAAGVDFLDLANALNDREADGDCWFGALGYLALQLAELVDGHQEPIELTPDEMKTAVRAYTNISRTFKVLKGPKYGLVPEEEWARLEPFGKMLNLIWNEIPGQESVREHLPSIINSSHKAWGKEKKNDTGPEKRQRGHRRHR